MSGGGLTTIQAAELNELFRLKVEGLLPAELFFNEVARVRDAIEAGTCRQLDARLYTVRKRRARQAGAHVPPGPRRKIHCRDRTDNNLGIILRRFGVGWNQMKRINTKSKLKVAQQKLRAHGFVDAEYAPLLDYVVDERAERQAYSDQMKDLLLRMVEEQKELIAERVKQVAKEQQQRAREEEAVQALLVL